MSSCLIDLIKPYIQEIAAEDVAQHLCVSPSDILKIEFWPFVLWCQVKNRGAVFVSPRQISFWIPAIKEAIAQCGDLDELAEIKAALEVEFRSKFDKKTKQQLYPPALQAELWELVEMREQQITEKTASRRQAESLSQSFELIIQQCGDKESLYAVAGLIRKNYPIFQGFPEILPHLRQVWALHRDEIYTYSL